jgi:hypothetical protein
MSGRAKLHPQVQRVMPVALHPEILRRILSNRIHVVLLTEPRAARLVPGDMLWVREPLTIPARQPEGGFLDVVYGGDGQLRRLRWPRVLARPGERHLPAEAMPVHASRVTLIVARAQRIRLQQIGTDDAVGAGVMVEPEGYGNPLAHEQYFGSVAEAFGRMWDCALGGRAIGLLAWTCNPEVTQLDVKTVMRNVADLVPGLGAGAAR